MSTLKLKKPANAAPSSDRRGAGRPGRPPVRPPSGPRPRQTLEQAQRERAERGGPDPRDPRGERPASNARDAGTTRDQGNASNARDLPDLRNAGKPRELRDRGAFGAADRDRRDGSRPVGRATPRPAGRDDSPRFESRPLERPAASAPRPSPRHPQQRPEQRSERPDGRSEGKGDRPDRIRNEDPRRPWSGPGVDDRSNRGSGSALNRNAGPGNTPDRGPRQGGAFDRDARPGNAFDRDTGRGGDQRSARPDDGRGGAAPGGGRDRRPDYVPRGDSPVGGRDRRPDLRSPRRDVRPAPRPDVRPALPPEPELRSDAEHEAFPNRPTGSPPEHVQGVKAAITGVRLSKRMSEMGLASRREADEWIQRGWVRVDGQVVSTLGSRVMPEQTVEIDERAVGQQAQRVTVLLHKPAGYVSGQAEDGNLPASVLCTPDHRSPLDGSGIAYTRDHVKGIAPAGRLDMESTGLLVFTQDGRIAKQLIGGDAQIEKEYFVKVANEHGEGRATGLGDDALALLREGIALDEVALRPAEVSWVGDELRFVLREGKKRQIRRMCEAVGLQVSELRRVRIGKVELGDLAEGQWRYLGPDESFV